MESDSCWVCAFKHGVTQCVTPDYCNPKDSRDTIPPDTSVPDTERMSITELEALGVEDNIPFPMEKIQVQSD